MAISPFGVNGDSQYAGSENYIVTDLLKALRDSSQRTVDCLGSGHVVPQQWLQQYSGSFSFVSAHARVT
jgi:hypothetical protein